MILGLSVALVVLLADQLSKYYILNYTLSDTLAIPVTSFFNIVRAWNTGISFSMFSNGGFWGTVALCVVALVIVAALIWWLKDEKHKLSQVALGMIIGGALGNIIDRIRLGAVFDFLDVYWADYHWPAFNVADSFISLGAIILIVFSIINAGKEKIKRS